MVNINDRRNYWCEQNGIDKSKTNITPTGDMGPDAGGQLTQIEIDAINGANLGAIPEAEVEAWVVNIKRVNIKSTIYKIAESQADQLSNNYSVTEAVRWTEDRAAIAAGNWSHFDSRSGSLTGQVYAETRVIPKITAGNIFLDKVIAKRTNLILALEGTLDEDLDSFDYTTMWDEATDYVPPPVEEVSTSTWDGVMASIPFNIKLW